MFKSYGFWTALAGAVVVLVNALGRCFGFSVEERLITDVIMGIAGLLVVFGVVSMPKKNKENSDATGESEKEQSSFKNNQEDEEEKKEEQLNENKQEFENSPSCDLNVNNTFTDCDFEKDDNNSNQDSQNEIESE